MGWFSSITHAVSGAIHSVEHAAESAVHGVEHAAESAVHGVESFAGDAFGVLKAGAGAALHGVEEVASDVEHGVEKAAKSTGNFFERAAKAVGHAFVDAGKGILNGIKDVGEGIVDGVVKFGKGLFVDGIGGFFSNIIHGDVKGAFGALIHGADEAFLQAPMSIANGFINGAQDALDGVTHLLPGPVGDFARQVVDRGADIVRTGVNTVGELGRDVFRFATETPLNFASDLYDAGNALVHGDWKNALGKFGMAFIHVGTHALNTATDMAMRTLQGAASITLEAIGLQPPSRKLTDDEKKLLREVYGDSVDVDAIRISEGGPLNNNMAPHTVGNTIYLPEGTSPGQALFDKNGKPTDYATLLIHETCHVWQSQNGGGEYIGQSLFNQAMATISGGSRNGAYDYQAAVAAGAPFSSLNPEQQAEYMQEVLGPILAMPGDPETNLQNSALAGDPQALAYAEGVLNQIRNGTGAA